MKIKAIIFDLDDTLFDCSVMLVENARKRAAKAMVSAGLRVKENELYRKMIEFANRFPRGDIFDKLSEFYRIKDQGIIEAGVNAYNSEEVENIKLFPDVMGTLENLRKDLKLILVTHGLYRRQKRKIELLGLKDKFDLVIINDSEIGESKDKPFLDVIKRFRLKPEEVLCVGDRIHAEIKIGNELGMITVQMLHGRFKGMKSKYDFEVPNYRIKKISELPWIIKTHSEKSLNIVAIGGGTGLPVLLSGLKKHTKNLTAIVTVMDSGRSSGVLRDEFNVLPPGDIRNCLIALSNSEKLLRDLFQYRFDKGALNGHSFGNLFITAMAKVTGSFEKSLKETSRILKLSGKVIPSTLEDAHLCAELEDGKIVEKENTIRKSRAGIKRVFLKPDNVKPFQEAIEAIENADIIVIGPGSLYTSIIPNLLVNKIPEAIAKSGARKVYVCNIVTQPDQTSGFSASDHLRIIENYLGKNVIDYVILNNRKPDKSLLKLYENDNSFLVENDLKNLKGTKPVVANVIEDLEEKRILWEKQDLIRHDPDKLARIILDCGNGNLGST